MDTEVKVWWKSIGVWGSLVTVLASLAGLAGYSVGPEDQAAIVASVNNAVAIGTEAVALIGGLTSLWGRIRATKKVAF